MTRSKRMQPIKDLADDRERDAGGVLGLARAKLAEHERQLTQLQAYHAEYAQRRASGAPADGIRLQNYHAFLSRLGQAIEQQAQLVASARAELEVAEAAWRERRIEASSIGKAVERIASGERREADRRDQRESDERALQQAQRSRGN
jgi:flagellar FliJ protein